MKEPKIMEDATLRATLRALPRARAGEDFTDRVMARLDALETASRTHAMPLGWLLATAAVVLCALALSFVFVQSQRQELTPAEQAEVHRLLEQHQQLEEELAAVRRAVRETEPILYLEGLPTPGGRSVDLVVEMPTQVRPAAYRLD